MDASLIAGVSTNLNAGLQIARALMGMRVDAAVLAKTTELQGVLASAVGQVIELQSALVAEQARVRELESQIGQMTDWKAQAKRYKLVAPYAGCMVYALQKSMSDGETAHYLCASCYQRGQRSILQGIEGYPRKGGGQVLGSYNCPVCKSDAFTGYMNAPAPQYFEDINPES